MLYLYLNLFLSVFLLAKKIQCKRYIYKQNKKYYNKIIVRKCADIEHFLNSNYCVINSYAVQI